MYLMYLRCLTDNTDADNASSGASPTQIVRDVTDAVSEKVSTHTKNIITKAKNSLSVLHKFSSEPEAEVDVEESGKVNDKAES